MALSRRQQLWNLAMQTAHLLGDIEDPDERSMLWERFNEHVEDELFVRDRTRVLDRRLLGDSLIAASVGVPVVRR